ncbi:flagellar hook-length control protein FliK, partial [Vibrio parahaemolyticus]|nr:flagellar hook-length control protein FliK [Vibrio parahaemolyticus]
VLPQSANLVHSFHEQATVSTHLDELALNETPLVHSLEQAQMIPGQDLEPILDKNGQPIDVDKLSPEFAAWQELARQASHPTA